MRATEEKEATAATKAVLAAAVTFSATPAAETVKEVTVGATATETGATAAETPPIGRFSYVSVDR